MAQYAVNFEEYPLGQQPSDWTERWNTGNSSWLVEEKGGKKMLVHTQSGGDQDRLLTWDDIGTASDVEILARIRTDRAPTNGEFQNTLFLRAQNSTHASRTGYLINLHRNSSGTEALSFEKYVNGSWTGVDWHQFNWSANTWYWIRFRVNGTSIKGKVWADGSAEPGWQIQETDSSISGSGWVGVASFTDNGTRDFDFVGIGTNGDTAPSEQTIAETTTFTDDAVLIDELPSNFSNGYAYRKKITIPASEVSSTLTDFPVYVDLSDLGSNFFSNIKSNGDDIRITPYENLTELPFELVDIDTTSETGELHFKTDLSSSSDNEFYIYYGNPDAGNGESVSSVWNGGYAGVWHLNDTPDALTGTFEHKDSSPNSNYGSSFGSHDATDGNPVAGKIGKALSFDGSNDYIEVPHGTDLELSTLTVSGWAYFDNMDSSWSFASESDPGEAEGFRLWSTSSGEYRFAGLKGGSWSSDTLSPSTIPAIGTWLLLHWVIDSSGITLYENGVEVASLSRSGSVGYADGAPFRMGSAHTSHITGKLDEMRIFDGVLDTNWIATEYANQNNPSSFYTVGVQESPSIIIEYTDDAVLRADRTVQSSSVDTFYVDGHQGISDPNGDWANDANAFDGDDTTSAGSSVSGSGLAGIGTTAVSNSQDISLVRVRIKAAASGSGEKGGPFTNATIYDGATSLGTASVGEDPAVYSSWSDLSEPSGGWTWQKVIDLKAEIATNYTGSIYIVEIEVTSGSDSSYSDDAFLYRQATVSITDDALLKAVVEKTFTDDAVLRKANDLTLTDDAIIRSVREATLTDDALLRQSTALTFTDDAFLSESTLVAFSDDAVLRAIQEVTFTDDAMILAGLHITDDALLRGQAEKTITDDTVLKGVQSIAYTDDAVILRGGALSLSDDALLRVDVEITFSDDALLHTDETVTHTEDALLRVRTTDEYTDDAVLWIKGTVTYKDNARLVVEIQKATAGTEGNYNPRREAVGSLSTGDGPESGNYNPRRDDDSNTYTPSDVDETGSWTAG